MEGIHGVDVSWLHQTSKDHSQRSHAPPSPPPPPKPSPPKQPHTRLSTAPPDTDIKPVTNGLSEKENISAITPNSGITPHNKNSNKRPGMLGRNSSDKGSAQSPDKLPRRSSWISSISAKFSPSPTTSPYESPVSPNPHHINTTISNTDGTSTEEEEKPPSPAPNTAKPGFFSSALRRLSTGTVNPGSKGVPNGGICPRKVLNVDPNRERCVMPELNNAKLRRVAFRVDVEIAGGPRYKDDDDFAAKKKATDKKLKEKGEGEALNHPGAVADQKDTNGVVAKSGEDVGTSEHPNPEGTTGANGAVGEKKDVSRKKEKKKRSEAERKERKEKKRRKAEENGQIPLELTQEDLSSGISTPTEAATSIRSQARPTTDPLRIYRRCCQLRETPILKRITDQLSAPSNCPISTPGVVSCLDLTGSRLQLADFVTLSDWLAIVPVKKLLLENADVGDEALRVILAGLLSARMPEMPRYRARSPSHKQSAELTAERYEERSGVVEKVTLKNNPKLTNEGWRHISLFIYMCKSLRALDVSMIPFARPSHGKRTTAATNQQDPASTKTLHADLAEIFSKAISERLGGSRFEELIMAECGLSTEDVRKIVDGVTWSGLKRLSLAGNNIDNDALEHILHYVRSGVCECLDLGGNDMRSRLKQLCTAFTSKCSVWALSLANCNLNPESLKPLFPALVSLSQLKFLDLSHNPELFSTDPSALTTLRKFLPQFKTLKRIHLLDVSMSPAQAIGLAEVLPEVSQLAHLNILENKQLSALSHATDEASQEEACALYASLMCAARASTSIIAIDIDVPGSSASEVVKALAKQVVAYCLRNMESWTATDAAEAGNQVVPVKIDAAGKHVDVPEVLQHLVGEGDDTGTAPDEDYIMGGTGVVKALSYCLLEKASDSRRVSVPTSGASTPRGNFEDRVASKRAKNVSKDLLDSARKIRARLQPAIVRESKTGDEMAYKRLLFLDDTLKGIIKRFEDEFPDTREEVPELKLNEQVFDKPLPPAHETSGSVNSDNQRPAYESDSEDGRNSPVLSRHNSDVSLASRALGVEEGQIHRLGQKMRRDILKNTSSATPNLPNEPAESGAEEPAHITALRAKLLSVPGPELLKMIQRDGWIEALKRIGENAEELKRLQEDNPDEFAQFKEAQLAALEHGGRIEEASAVRQMEQTVS